MSALHHDVPMSPVLEPQWVPDPRAVQAPARARPWLEEPGLLTERVRAHGAGPFALIIVAERRDTLLPADARALGSDGADAFIREIEMSSGADVLVFAQTLVPATTLANEPWITALGDDALGPRLARMGGAVRDPLEYGRLEPGHALFARAWRGPNAPACLWARRGRYRLAGGLLIVQEIFLPAAYA